jgi:hypothetical protein
VERAHPVSDDRERDLERRMRQGDPDARAAFQRSRQRTGCAGVVHSEHLSEDEQRVANAHDMIAERDPNILGLIKRCDLCGKAVRIAGRGE